MEQSANQISVEELFGEASYLVAQSGENATYGIASLGVGYQVVTAIVALLFILLIVRYSNLIIYLLFSSISSKTRRSDIHIYSAETNNIKILTALAGVLLLALLVMRLSVIDEMKQYLAPILEIPKWGIGGVTLGGILLLIIVEYILLWVVGIISEQRKFCSAIWHSKMLHFSTTIIVISPMLILALLTEGVTASIALYGSVAACSISLILFIKETFSLFRTQRFSIFHWILYLCALELFPLSVLLAPILRG